MEFFVVRRLFQVAIESRSHGRQTISLVITPVFPPEWDDKHLFIDINSVCCWNHSFRLIKCCENLIFVLITHAYHVSLLRLAQFSHLISKESVIPNFVTYLVFLGIAFSFMKSISSYDTSTKRGKARGDHFDKLSFRYNHLAGGDYSRIWSHSRPMRAREFL